MDDITIWNMTTGHPQRFQGGKVSVEKTLEDWIERDPVLVQEGLLVVARDMPTEAGTIDLLGIEPAGRWVVIEIKNGSVRKETIAQAKSYATRISDMDEDELITKIEAYLKPRAIEIQALLAAHKIDDQILFRNREVIIFIVGTGQDQALEPFAKTLSFKDKPINVLSFDIFENDAGEQILIRKAIQPDVVSPSTNAKAKKIPLPVKHWPSTPAIERLLKLAGENGVGDDFRLIHETAIRHGLYPRTYRWSIMYTPPQNRTRCLICLWANRQNEQLHVYVASSALAEFYPISEQQVVQILGKGGYRRIPRGKADSFAAALDKLFETISSSD